MKRCCWVWLVVIAGALHAAEPKAPWKTIAPFAAPPAEYSSKLGDYRSPLLFDDGKPVTTPSDWARRREELLKAWHDLMGPWPKVIDKPKLEFLARDDRDGLRQDKVRVEIAPGQTGDGYLLRPEGRGPFPAVLVVYYEPETSVGLNPKQTLRDFALQLAKRGFVTLSIGTPGGNAWKPELKQAVCQPLSYHAYVAANCWHVLANRPEVDPARIGVVGHSYGGKWSMFAGALWDRFAAVATSDPGIVFDEKRSNVNYWEPWYLGFDPNEKRPKAGIPSDASPRTGAYKKMIANKRDLHEIHALIAPRPFFVSGGSEDQAERWVPLNHSIAVNKLLGFNDRVFMTNRKGHTPTEDSNEQLYSFFEHFLLRRPGKTADLSKAVTFYASFDRDVAGDHGRGGKSLSTRFNHETEKGQFVFEKGFNDKAFRIAKDKGISGGALDCTDVLPRNGRIFFPAKGNIAYKKGGWGGTMSMWINTDPNTLLKTKFCDPVQITHRGANNGGIWFDFNDAKPRDMRMGMFPAIPEGGVGIKEEDANAPMVRVKAVGFKAGEWHHVVLTWRNFDTGKSDAHASLYIDGRQIGVVKDRAIAMDWNTDRAGIYIAVNYIGLIDEFAIFDRELSAEEVGALHQNPGALSSLKTRAGKPALGEDVPPPAPKFPFSMRSARKYQEDFATWAGPEPEFTTCTGQVLVLVPPGTFIMGSPKEEPGHGSGGYDETQHAVTITQYLHISKFETTVGQFRRFVEATGYITDGEKNGGGHAHDAKAVWLHRDGTNWRKPGYAGAFELKDEHPVVHVSHSDALAYCRWLNQHHAIAGWQWDLPTEAEWEWACRAGSADRFWWGAEDDSTGKVANVGDRTLKRVHRDWPRLIMPMDDGHAFPAPVGSYRANGFGLHDMLGNVWEFCSTRYGPYPKDAVVDPGDGDPNRGFAVRGGGWSNVPNDARCASRNADPAHFCHSNLGFRVVLRPMKAGR